MAWIESHQSLSRHRKTLEAVALLHVDRHKFIGHLHELWWWGLDNANTDGQLGQVPSRTLANAAGWPIKDADRFTEVLVIAGFIEQGDDGYVLHDWFDYAGKLNEQRARNRARMAAARAERVQRTNDARVEHVQDTSGARAPATNRTNQPDQPTNRTDAADAASPRARDGSGGDDFSSRSDVEQQCPMAGHTFRGDYGQHLATDERHQRLPPPAPVGLRSIGSLLPAEVRQRLNQPPIGGDEHADG